MRPARATASSSGAARLRDELARTLATLEREVEEAIARPRLDAEEIHDIHRDLRRVASGLSVWGHVVPLREAATVRETVRRTRRLARLVGRVRDHDVIDELLSHSGRSGPRGPLAWHEFLRQQREDAETGRELLRAFLRTERQGGLFARAQELLGLAPRPDAERGLHRVLAEERRLRQGRVRRAHRRAVRKPSIARLHRLRIRIRQWRHLTALELISRATAPHPPPPAWRRFQEQLGHLHDLDLAISTVPRTLLDAGPARRLRLARRRLRGAVAANLQRIVLSATGGRPQRVRRGRR